MCDKSILLVDDDADFLEVLGERCRSIGLEVRQAHNLLTAMSLVEKQIPDALCIDVEMPTGNGLEFCKMLAADPGTAHVPMIVLTGQRDSDTTEACQQLGAEHVLKTTDVWKHVGPVIRQALGKDKLEQRQGAPLSEEANGPEVSNESSRDALMDAVFDMLDNDPSLIEIETSSENNDTDALPERKDIPWVLCIDDDADFSDALKCRLESHGVAVVRAFDGSAGYRKAFTHPASAILLDYEMPNGQGDYVLRRLKENPVTRDIPVTMVTGINDKIIERKMLGMGADGYLTKPVKFATIRNELAKYIDILATTKEATLLG